MHNYIKELKQRAESESDEHRRFLIESTLAEVELSYKQRIEYCKNMAYLKKENNMSKTTTTTQYAAFAKRIDGTWIKLNGLFYFKSKDEAQRCIDAYRDSFEGQHWPHEYKIMGRVVTTITGEWGDVQ